MLKELNEDMLKLVQEYIHTEIEALDSNILKDKHNHIRLEYIKNWKSITLDCVNKQIPLKVVDIHVDDYICPNCFNEGNTIDDKVIPKYCQTCGQRLIQEEYNIL